MTPSRGFARAAARAGLVGGRHLRPTTRQACAQASEMPRAPQAESALTPRIARMRPSASTPNLWVVSNAWKKYSKSLRPEDPQPNDGGSLRFNVVELSSRRHTGGRLRIGRLLHDDRLLARAIHPAQGQFRSIAHSDCLCRMRRTSASFHRWVDATTSIRRTEFATGHRATSRAIWAASSARPIGRPIPLHSRQLVPVSPLPASPPSRQDSSPQSLALSDISSLWSRMQTAATNPGPPRPGSYWSSPLPFLTLSHRASCNLCRLWPGSWAVSSSHF